MASDTSAAVAFFFSRSFANARWECFASPVTRCGQQRTSGGGGRPARGPRGAFGIRRTGRD
eukprot:3127804-Lingulodinium_polyedra.AAC.1